jgi:hypothetical protein
LTLGCASAAPAARPAATSTARTAIFMSFLLML